MSIDRSTLTLVIIILITANVVQTQYITQTTPSQDTWQTESGHTITPTQSTSYGTIRIGQKMSIEFDVTFHGRSDNPREGYQENFFRIGKPGTVGTGCNGEGSRYPSMFLTRESLGTMLDISTSSGISCGTNTILYDYNETNFGIEHHIKISLDNTLLQVWINGGGKQDYHRTFPRNPTQEKYINESVPIWFMSDAFYPSTPFNVGSATFSNIIIKSSLFCIGSCTETPTISPTVKPTISPTTTTYKPTTNQPTTYTPTTYAPTTYTPTKIPTNYPTISPTNYPTNYPTKTPTNYPTKTPTNYPSISPTNFPTYQPTINPTNSPITAQPTMSPITAQPTMSPITAQPTQPTLTPSTRGPTTEIPTKYPTYNPTITPTYRPTTKPVFTMRIDDTIHTTYSTIISDNLDANIAVDPNFLTKGILIGVSITATVVSACIIWGICMLCKRERKSIRQAKKRGTSSSNIYGTDDPQHGIHGNGHQMNVDFDVTNINIANSHNIKIDEQEQYLSDAQKDELYKTAGGPSYNNKIEINPDESATTSIIFDEYLSDAQKEQMSGNMKVTPKGLTEYEGKKAPQRRNLNRQPTTDDLNEMMHFKEESDNEVVSNIGILKRKVTPIGPADMSPIVMGDTPKGNSNIGSDNIENIDGFVEIVYDEGHNGFRAEYRE